MSLQAKRELLGQTAPRYRAASARQKRTILDEFVAATGYARKYAIRLLGQPNVPRPAPIRRPRARTYGPEVVATLTVAWAATNYVCAKRLVPFLPELVPALERHGHLAVSPEVRAQLLTLSPATADRLLRPLRERTRPRGIGTTTAGTLLKHKVPIRTFAEWNDVRPGFLEVDTVAHCGTRTEGPYLSSLVLTDVATGWTECLALVRHGYDAVLGALDQARDRFPFPVLGLDTDNGSEFLNFPLLGYCERAKITFTRGRAYRKNDQCYVEQKNGSIVRQICDLKRILAAMASIRFKAAGMGPYPPEKHVRLSLETRGHGMLDIPTHGQLMIETGNRRQPEYGRPSLEQDDLTAKLCFQARPRYGLSHKGPPPSSRLSYSGTSCPPSSSCP